MARSSDPLGAIAYVDLPTQIRPRSAPGATLSECQNCVMRGNSLCSCLQGSELAELNALVHDTLYQDKDVLFDQDIPDSYVHIIRDGMIRLHRTLPDGRRTVIGFAMAGDFLGLSFADHHACSADAIGTVSTCKISRDAYSSLLDSKPHLLRALHSMTAHELTIAHDHMIILGRFSARERVASFIINFRERMKRLTGQSFNIPLPMTREDIANFLGMTIETASRTFSALARDKLIVIVPDGVRVLDSARLEALADGHARSF